MTNTTARRRKFFDCVAGTDGCDETFEIISRTTGCRIAWAGFWEHRIQCRRVARALNAALNAAFASRRIEFDVSSLANEQRQIAIVWNTDDVLEVRPDLSEEQAWEVLQLAEREHDATSGINWESLEAIADSLYGEAPEQGGSDE
jgi:hypothetical protein